MPRYKPKAGSHATICSRFRPLFWKLDADQRSFASRTINQRFKRLCEDAGVDSYQKELIAQEIVFIGLQLETARVTTVTSGVFDGKTYSMLSNTYFGLLKVLGVEKQRKTVRSIVDFQHQPDDDDE